MTSRSFVLFSGEGGSIPPAEARALFLAYDPLSHFEHPEPRVLLAESRADPFIVSSRIAFSRRVGILLEEASEASEWVRDRKIRFRQFSLGLRPSPVEAGAVLRGIEADIDLANPDYEFTLVDGEKRYLVLTRPSIMRQEWSLRRPRKRPFFHPSAIFPKLSRALVNLSRCREGGILLDPFAGTGSLPIEAAEVGARVIAADQVLKMTTGALLNMKRFKQDWLGVVRADAFASPIRRVDAVATDIPYGRASSTRGSAVMGIIERTLSCLPQIVGRGSRVVLMHPSSVPVESTEELAVEEEHYLYVHKRLTRAITILRRN